MGPDGFGVLGTARVGQHHIDAAPVVGTHGALDEPVPFEAGDNPGQCALGQLHPVAEFLHTSAGGIAGGGSLHQLFQHLELAEAEVVPVAQSPIQRTGRRVIPLKQLTPTVHEFVLSHGRDASTCTYT